jgi:hypothetical protein
MAQLPFDLSARGKTRRTHVKINPAKRSSGVRIVHNRLLGGWYIVRGPHQTPISGRFDSKGEAESWLNRQKRNDPDAWLVRKNPPRRKTKRRGPRKMTALQRRYFGKGHKPVRRKARRTRKNPVHAMAGISAANLATFRKFLKAPKGAKLIKK